MSESAQSGLPLLYKSVEPLDKERHASLGILSSRSSFSFAARASAVPVNIAEFNFALKSFPIVFTSATDPQAIAVMGLQQDQNLFVKPDGSWLPGSYIPLYVRRYPFIFGALQTDNQFALCVDTAAEMVSNDADQPFFHNGELAEAAKRGIENCQSFQAQHAATRKIMDRLASSGLLESREATITLRNGTVRVLGTYVGVNEARLAALSDEQFLQLRRDDLLPVIYLHLASLSNWMRLLDLHVARNMAESTMQPAAETGASLSPQT